MNNTKRKIEEQSGFKTCTCCGIKKELIGFSEKPKHRISIKGSSYYSQCDICRLQLAKEYYARNKECRLVYQKKYNKKNQSKLRVGKTCNSSFYRARIKSAIPKWVSTEERKQIRLLYQQKETLQIANGKEYNIDHIIPLNSKVVCGLHILSNLRIIDADLNNQKGNKIDNNLLSELYTNYHPFELSHDLLEMIYDYEG